MSRYIQKYKLKPDDEIVVPKSVFNFVQHHAIYLGLDRNGNHWIVENKIGGGVQLISADDFFASVSTVNKIIPFSGTNDQRKLFVYKALNSLGKPYNLIQYNCEHFITELKTGKAKSQQLANAVAGLFGFLIIGAIFSDL